MKGKMFKVLSPIEKKGGGTYWMRCGTGFENKDGSYNMYLDAFPKNFQLQLREMDEDDLTRSDGSRRTNHVTGVPPMAAPTTAQESVPF